MPILDPLFAPFRRQKTSVPVQPLVVTDVDTDLPQVMTVRTLVIVYEPTMDVRTGTKLTRYMSWNPVEDLARGYISDVLEASAGLVRHQIVQRIDVDEFHTKLDGFRYDPLGYYHVMQRQQRPHRPADRRAARSGEIPDQGQSGPTA